MFSHTICTSNTKSCNSVLNDKFKAWAACLVSTSANTAVVPYKGRNMLGTTMLRSFAWAFKRGDCEMSAGENTEEY